MERWMDKVAHLRSWKRQTLGPGDYQRDILRFGSQFQIVLSAASQARNNINGSSTRSALLAEVVPMVRPDWLYLCLYLSVLTFQSGGMCLNSTDLFSLIHDHGLRGLHHHRPRAPPIRDWPV